MMASSVRSISVSCLLLGVLFSGLQTAHSGPPPNTSNVAASPTSSFSLYCPGTSKISSLNWAIDTCHSFGGWLATPQNYEDDMAIRSAMVSVLGSIASNDYCLLGGSDAWVESRWVWVDGPEKGRLFWTGTLPADGGAPIAGRYVPPTYQFSPEDTSSPDSGDLMVWFYPSGVLRWGDVPDFTSVRCYACQFQTCANMCNATHTASYTGDWWPNCVCKCKPGWRGERCDIQFTSHCTAGHAAVGTIAVPIADCHARGGYLATPRSFGDDTAILSLGNVTPTPPGPLTYTLTAGSDSELQGYWRWLDGPEKGDLFYVGYAGSTSPAEVPLLSAPRYTNFYSSMQPHSSSTSEDPPYWPTWPSPTSVYRAGPASTRPAPKCAT